MLSSTALVVVMGMSSQSSVYAKDLVNENDYTTKTRGVAVPKGSISREDLDKVSGGALLSSEYARQNREKEITNQDRHTFAHLAYLSNAKDQSSYNVTRARMENDGWTLKKVKGKTNSVESNMVVMGFRGKQVIIASRGTEMTNANDWLTNLDFAKNKQAAELLGIKEGYVHNGFLQAHLSTWDEIKSNLLFYAKKRGVKVSDLEIETTGHSLGAAQQDLNQLHLLKDHDLDLGMKKVQDSFMYDDFYGMSLHESIVGSDKVRGTAFAGPKVFDQKGADEFKKAVKEGHSPHVVNKHDVVPKVPFNFIGFQDVGDIVDIDTNSNIADAHSLDVMKKKALKALDKTKKQTTATEKADGKTKESNSTATKSKNLLSKAWDAVKVW